MLEFLYWTAYKTDRYWRLLSFILLLACTRDGHGTLAVTVAHLLLWMLSNKFLFGQSGIIFSRHHHSVKIDQNVFGPVRDLEHFVIFSNLELLKKVDHSRPLFHYLLFNTVDKKQILNISFVVEWIQTSDVGNNLSANHCATTTVHLWKLLMKHFI